MSFRQVEKSLMDAGVSESSGWKVAAMTLPCRTATGSSAFGGDDFNAFADVLDLGGADEDHFERRSAACGTEG